VASTFAPTRDVVSGTRIGSLDVQDFTGLNLPNFFLGAKKWHGAAQTTGIQDSGDSQTFRGNLYVTHECSPYDIFDVNKPAMHKKTLLYLEIKCEIVKVETINQAKVSHQL
jgi:hypothetical protein